MIEKQIYFIKHRSAALFLQKALRKGEKQPDRYKNLREKERKGNENKSQKNKRPVSGIGFMKVKILQLIFMMSS